MTSEVSDCLAPGVHGTTFGGNPLAMAACNAVVDVIDQPDFLAQVRQKGELLSGALTDLVASDNRVVAGHRGMGLMLGLQLHEDQSVLDLVEAARQQGLLTVPAGDQTVRLLPPLIVSDAEIIMALERLTAAVKSL